MDHDLAPAEVQSCPPGVAAKVNPVSLDSAADIPRIQAHTGCDGLMIGRAAIGNPWIFQRRNLPDVPWAERVPVILEHLHRMVDFHGEVQGHRRFRKHLRRYLTSTDVSRQQRRAFLHCEDFGAFTALLESVAGV